MTENKIITVQGTAYYCRPNRLDDLSGKYQMDLGNLEDRMVKAFQNFGIKVKFDTKNAPGHPDHKGYFVTPKSETPVSVVDMGGNEIPTNLLVGNGSKVIAGLRIAPYTFGNKRGHKLVWLGLKVQELVKYDPDKANKEKAMRLLDGISGEGFVFGEGTAEPTSAATSGSTGSETPNFDELFGDAQ